MKRFRVITVSCLAAISIMVAGNIYYLFSLYGSLREQTLQTVGECVRRAYILDIINRMKDGTQGGENDSFVRLTLLVQGEARPDGGYEYPNLLERFERTMCEYFSFVADNDTAMPAVDYDVLSGVFRHELNSAGLTPESACLLPYGVEDGGSMDDGGMWSLDFSVNPQNAPVYTARFSSLNGHILGQMAGIIITSLGILSLMGFLIWYLLHWVGRLRSIEQMKDDFTHNMTHELKTPVAVAYSAADSMLRYYDQSDEARNRQFLKIIIQRLGFLSGMIENILSMSMERFKTMKLDKERLRLRDLVAEVAGMIELKADKPVEITIDIPGDMEVYADPLHLGNIISNLLDNAVKYSGESVRIEIKADDRSLTVSDNGIGIDREHLPHIFGKFYRVTDGDRYEAGGYGLGLYYVRQVVQLMGWGIEVESTPGKGTTFTITYGDYEKR